MATSRHEGHSWLCAFCAGCLMLLSATAAATVTNVADVARAVLEPWAGEVVFDLTATVTCVIPCENKLSFAILFSVFFTTFMFLTSRRTTEDKWRWSWEMKNARVKPVRL